MIERLPLVYVLHAGNLYGTERVALATADGLRDDFDPIILSPPGPVQDEARRLGMAAHPFRGARQLARRLWPILGRHRDLAFCSTSVTQSATCLLLNLLRRRNVRHLHVVHGSDDERAAYGRKHWLNRAPLRIVAVSNFARDRLIANGVRPDRVAVIENFLAPERLAAGPRRPPFARDGEVRRVVVVSRLVPNKRVHVLLDALDLDPSLRDLDVRIVGAGELMHPLSERARANHPNVTFAGFCPDVPGELAAADLLVHLCPFEAFGLVVLEAMAADLPVLVCDRGGAADLVEDDVTGFRFPTDDAAALAARLRAVRAMPAGRLNGVVAAARASIETRFSAAGRLAAYRRLLGAAP